MFFLVPSFSAGPRDWWSHVGFPAMPKVWGKKSIQNHPVSLYQVRRMRHEGFWEGEQKPSEDCFEKTITAEWFWKVRWPGKGCCTGYSMPDSHQRKQAQTWRTSEQESDCGLVSKAVLHFGDHVLESCGGRVLAASQAFQSNPLPEIHAFEEWRLSFSRTEDIKSISVFQSLNLPQGL